MSTHSDISDDMNGNELHDEHVERLLSGTAVPGHEDVSMLIGQLRAVYTDPAPTPVGVALAEFVDVEPAAYCGGDMSATDYRDLFEPAPPVIELSAPLDVRSNRRSAMLWKKVSASVIMAGAGVVFLASLASAGSSLGDGDYTLVLPGVGEFEFTIDSTDSTSDTVIAVAAPSDYTIDDDDPEKAAWKDMASLEIEVEIKTDKIEGDVDWDDPKITEAELTLPDGGSITVTKPDLDGDFTVTASGGWWAFGSGSDWFVANIADLNNINPDNKEQRFFKVEATGDGIEIKPVDSPDGGFLNDLDDDEEEELEVEELEVEEVESEDDESDDEKDRGRGKSDD